MVHNRSAQASLEITGPGIAPRNHDLSGPLVIGRAPDAGLNLTHPSVSRRHAELSLDATRQWRVRDLASRNGTFVNGQPIREISLRAGDVLRIGEFSLRLVAQDDLQNAVINVNGVPAGDDAPGSIITSLRNVEPPRLSAALISVVLEFGQTLVQLGDPAERLRRLIELPTGADVGAWWCHALSVRRTAGPHDELEIEALCRPTRSEAGAAHEPHVSRTVLRAVLDSNGPVIANNLLRPTKFDAAMTVTPSNKPIAAVACPIDDVSSQSPQQAVRILYVTLAPLIASLEWLVVINLAVQQFRQVELSWEVRQADLARAALDREMAWARELQAHTLPRHDPSHHNMIDWALRFEPCLAVGGDYADVIWRRDGRVLVVMADVSGKGMRAALLASKLHTIFNADESCSSLEDLIAAANRHLSRVLPDASFVTLVAMLIDPTTGEVTCVNCGHPPPLAFSKNDGIHPLPGGDNFPLGLISGEPFRSEQFAIQLDDWVVLYTDGITEMTNPRDQMLGSESFEAILSKVRADSSLKTAESFVAHIREHLQAYRGDAMASDDLTLLTFRLSSPSAT